MRVEEREWTGPIDVYDGRRHIVIVNLLLALVRNLDGFSLGQRLQHSVHINGAFDDLIDEQLIGHGSTKVERWRLAHHMNDFSVDRAPSQGRHGLFVSVPIKGSEQSATVMLLQLRMRIKLHLHAHAAERSWTVCVEQRLEVRRRPESMVVR